MQAPQILQTTAHLLKFCKKQGQSRHDSILRGVVPCFAMSTAQHSTAQHSTAQHKLAQHSVAEHSMAFHSTADASLPLAHHTRSVTFMQHDHSSIVDSLAKGFLSWCWTRPQTAHSCDRPAAHACPTTQRPAQQKQHLLLGHTSWLSQERCWGVADCVLAHTHYQMPAS